MNKKVVLVVDEDSHRAENCSSLSDWKLLKQAIRIMRSKLKFLRNLSEVDGIYFSFVNREGCCARGKNIAETLG